jgi:ring-1,2-phenylacetyl-CoA epoxidase subunit PaaD
MQDGRQQMMQDHTQRAAQIAAVLAKVPDPEIPVVSVVDLGIVRNIDVQKNVLTITPTYSGCPATMVIERDIRGALDVAGFSDMRIETSLSPAWTKDWITDAGKLKLTQYGIAPPSRSALAQCPNCKSNHTEEISRFGSTPCKSLWRCKACLEPFDRFKCH